MAEEQEETSAEETENATEESTPEGTFVNGEFVTTDELRSGYMRNSNFTQKSQALAEERAEVQSKQEAIAKTASDAKEALALAEAKEAALATDTKWYSEHSQEEWANYVPEISKLNSGQAPRPTPQSEPANNVQLDRIEQKLEAQEQKDRRAALEAQVDSVLAEVDRVRKADFPLADTDMVQAKIEAHQSLNSGRLPSLAEIRQFSKDVHDKFVQAGARVPMGVQTESSKVDVAPGQSVPVLNDKHSEIDLNSDPDRAEHALKDYMASKLAAQES